MIQISIRPVGASLTRDTEVIGKMDPYCVLTLGTEKHQTKHKNEAGKEVQWDETFTFLNTGGTNVLNVAVWDKDVTTSDLVGEGLYDLTYALKSFNTPINETVHLSYKGKPAGKVYLSVQTSPVGGQGQHQHGQHCHDHGNKGGW